MQTNHQSMTFQHICTIYIYINYDYVKFMSSLCQVYVKFKSSLCQVYEQLTGMIILEKKLLP